MTTHPTDQPNASDAAAILLGAGAIKAEQADEVRSHAQATGQSQMRAAISLGYVTVETAKEIIAANSDAEIISDLSAVKVDQDAIAMIPASRARKWSIIPLHFRGDELVVATTAANYNSAELRDDLRLLLTGRSFRLVVAQDRDIAAKLDTEYRHEVELRSLAQRAAESAAGDATEMAVPIANLILDQAITDRASDIHIEPTASDVRVRYRIDGVLVEKPSAPKNVQGGLISRLKIMANLDIAESRIPQDGQLAMNTKTGRRVEMRVSSLPTVHGEKVVMRILDNSSGLTTLDSLDLVDENLVRWRNAAKRPQGLMLCTGPTGSGKALALDTPLPTPSGWTTMGEVRVGDAVLGRDGRPCTVTGLSPINPTPTLYRVTFSDGQTLDADMDHQWLVSTHQSRSVPRTKKRRAAIERHTVEHQRADDLELLAARVDDSHVTTNELFVLLAECGLIGDTKTASGLYQALRMTDCPAREATRDCPVEAVTNRLQEVRVYDVSHVLRVIGESASTRSAEARAMLASGEYPSVAPTRDIADLFTANRPVTFVNDAVRSGGIDWTVATREDTIKTSHTRTRPVVEYPLAAALACLATRIREQYSHAPSDEAAMHRLTTADLVENGLRLTTGHANYAVPITEAIDLPDTDLPVDPYILGVWLGDGQSDQGYFAADVSDQPHLIEQLTAAGYEARKRASADYMVCVGDPLTGDLRRAGVLRNKHIPAAYMRASRAQRLALLQGLMDTDGTIGSQGSCEFTQGGVNRDLAVQALELARSLGIKASEVSDEPSHYTNTDGKRVECSGKHRFTFTTDLPVFRMPRKAALLPEPGTLRETQRWNYITDIEEIVSVPARCISVDSPDHTYLAGTGFVVTSNSSTLMATLAEVSRPEVNVVTVEDPVERKLNGVNQVQVNVKAKMTFAAALRSILRQDPDIILIGEIRDKETADIAIEASLTGHLVLSTLHTNNAPEAATRLAEMGAEGFLIGSVLECAMAQRLVRRLCGRCKRPSVLTPEDLESVGFEVPDGQEVTLYDPVGCSACTGTGYRGRIAVQEAMSRTPALERLIVQGKTSDIIGEQAMKDGMRTMKQDGWQKAAMGLTTIAEVLRVVG